MKKVLLVLLIFLNFVDITAQQSVEEREYVININGYIQQGRRTCRTNGLQTIRLFFATGAPVYVFDSSPAPYNGSFSNRYFGSEPFVFKESDRVTRVEFISHRRGNSGISGCDSSETVDTQYINIPLTNCFYQEYDRDQVFPTQNEGRLPRGYARISISPKPKIWFSDLTVDITSTYSACSNLGVDIEAKEGYTFPDNTYKWLFLDPVNTETRPHPTYQALVNALARAQAAYRACTIQTGDPDRCIGQEEAVFQARRALDRYTGPQTHQVPIWRPIDSKIGQYLINLKPSDLYPGDQAAQAASINKNIQIKLAPKCDLFPGTRDNFLNILTIQFLPPPPDIIGVPEIQQPNCSDGSAEITFSFDRNLRADEDLYINLQKQREGGDYQSEGNNILFGGNSPFQLINGVWKYTFNREGNPIGTGRYKIEVGGYNSSIGAPTCLKDPIPNGFAITLPDPVTFNAEKGNNQQCFNTNDGSINITAVSGGSGTYFYSLNNGVNWSTTSFSGPYSIKNLATGTYNVRVRDNKGCVAKETNGDPKTEVITLDPIIEITHEVGTISLPEQFGSNDAEIEITKVNGGTPYTTPAYYKYEVLIKGDENNSTGIKVFPDVAYASGFRIFDLPSGIHTIRYHDVNGCTKDIMMPEIFEPVTISKIDISNPIGCTGGKATVIVTAKGGENGNYEYKESRIQNTDWQDSNTFLLAATTISGGYTFQVRDKDNKTNISKVSDKLEISQPSEISIIVKPENIISNNIFGDNKGAITLDVSGGTLNSMTPEYNVAWKRNGDPISNTGVSISGLLAGTYIATVRDANGCIQPSDGIVITEPDELLVSIQETTPILCFGGVGSLTAVPVGGSGDYRYQWYKDGNPITDQVAKTISNIQKGNYTIRVDDEYTFKESAPKIFGEPDQLSLSLVGEDVSCFNGNDGKIILNPEGGIAPYSYSIDNKVTYIPVDDLTNLTIEGLVAGSYSVWLRDDNGCETLMAETIPIAVPDEIMIEETLLEHVTVMGGSDGSISISVTGGTPRTTNPNYSITWEKDGAPITNTGTSISNLSFGSYTVFVKDDNDCGIDRTFEVKQPLPMQVSISETSPILCHDDELGELLATVTGGYPIDSSPSDFEYRWYRIENSLETLINTDVTLDRLDNLAAGTYKVVATDGQGTSTNETFDLLEPDDLLVSLANTPVDVKCYGEPTGAIDITIVGGPKDEITGEYLPYTFSWTKVGDPDFKATTEDLQNITAGTYEVVVIDDNLCTTSLSEAVIIDQPDAVLEIYDVKPINLSGFQTQDGSISLEVKGGTPPYRYSWTDIDDPNYTADSQDIKDLSIGTYELVITDANDCTTSITELITEPNQLTVSITPLADDKGVQCFGGQTLLPLLATTQGGIGSYTYEWYEESDLTTIIFTTSETTEVEAGTYVVVVTDENGNKDDDTYEVTQPDMLDISENITHLLCRGDDNGRIDITVSGGVPPYKYSWGTGETTEDLPSLRAGKYTITITDANDCMLQKEIEVEQPQGLFVNGAISRIYPSSNGATDGSITVNIGGGTPPYAYEWRDFSNVLQASTTNVLDAIGAEKYSLTVIDANDCILVIEDVDVFEPPILEVFVEQVNVVTCNSVSSASLRAIVTGGVPYNDAKQYNYQWFDANTNSAIGGDRFLIENIGAGTYYVIVSDALDTSITSEVFTVGEPDTLESEMRTDFVNCGDRNDWTIIPQITGGTAPYTFLWNTGDTENALENVSAGSYSVTITDVRGCFVMDQVTVAPPEALITLEELTIPTCFKGCDGAIVLETIGGTPPYSYEWSNGTAKKDLIDICADTYSVMITDAKGCMITKEFILDNPSEFSIDLGEDITLCQDQTAVLNATIEDPNATYLWTTSDGFSSTSATIDVRDSNIYEVLVIDSKGCEARGDIFVDTITDAISAHFIASSQVFTGEEFVIVDNSDPVPESIDWIFPEEATVLYEDEHYAELIFDKPGEYEVTLQTSIGLCSALITKTIIVLDKEIEEEPGAGEGTIDIETLFEYKVYPNPTLDGQFTVDVNLKKVQPINLKIFNIIDNKLLDSRNGKDKDTYTFEYDMSSLPSGVYFILLETPSASQVRKLVKE